MALVSTASHYHYGNVHLSCSFLRGICVRGWILHERLRRPRCLQDSLCCDSFFYHMCYLFPLFILYYLGSGIVRYVNLLMILHSCTPLRMTLRTPLSPLSLLSSPDACPVHPALKPHPDLYLRLTSAYLDNRLQSTLLATLLPLPLPLPHLPFLPTIFFTHFFTLIPILASDFTLYDSWSALYILASLSPSH